MIYTSLNLQAAIRALADLEFRRDILGEPGLDQAIAAAEGEATRVERLEPPLMLPGVRA